jgi:Holliday junction resolvase RusA-like endonuclease
MDELTVTILGQPVPKGRPRMARTGRAYTPLRTRRYEDRVRACAKDAMRGCQPLQGPLTARVAAFFSIPVSWPQWKRDAALGGSLRHTGTPDLDNLIKVIDGLNGVVFPDDGAICHIVATKDYSATPRTEITITRAAGIPSQTTSRESSK